MRCALCVVCNRTEPNRRETYGYFADDVAKYPESVGREWQSYVEHIDSTVEHALRSTVVRSLQELARSLSTDTKTGHGHPFLTLGMVFDEDTKAADYKPPHSLLNRSISDIIQHSVATVQTVPRLTELLESTVMKQHQQQMLAQLKAQEAADNKQGGGSGNSAAGDSTSSTAAAPSAATPHASAAAGASGSAAPPSTRAADGKSGTASTTDLKAVVAAATAALAVPAPKQKPFFTLIYNDPQVSALVSCCVCCVGVGVRFC